MNYTDEQLKRALAKMLPEHILNPPTNAIVVFWRRTNIDDAEDHPVLDTELLYLCSLAEVALRVAPGTWQPGGRGYYMAELCEVVGHPRARSVDESYRVVTASWQQRTIALAKTKGIEIV